MEKTTIFVSNDTDDKQYGKVVKDKIFCNSNDYYYHSIISLYIFPSDAVEKVKQVEISERGLLEITSLSKLFQDEDKLQIQALSPNCKWLDTNTFDSLLKAGEIVKYHRK